MRMRVLALLFSIPLAASGAAGVLLHVCQSMGGVVVGGCDCEKPAEHATNEGHGEHAGHAQHAGHAAQQATDELRTQPCCSIEQSNASRLLAIQKAFAPLVDQAPMALVGLGSSELVDSMQLCELGFIQERGPPNIHGPPLFIRHCSFLN